MAKDLHLSAQPLELLTLLGGEPLPFAPVDLGLPYPVPQGVVRDPKLLGNLRDRSTRGVDEPDRLCLELWRILRFCPWHSKLLPENLLSSMFGCPWCRVNSRAVAWYGFLLPVRFPRS
jgi:hypothetical protein